MVATTAIKLSCMRIDPTCGQPTADKLQLHLKTKTLFALTNSGYNSSHFYMVGLVWFPGYMDWNVENVVCEIRGQTQMSEVICTMCTPSHIACAHYACYRTWYSTVLVYEIKGHCFRHRPSD